MVKENRRPKSYTELTRSRKAFRALKSLRPRHRLQPTRHGKWRKRTALFATVPVSALVGFTGATSANADYAPVAAESSLIATTLNADMKENTDAFVSPPVEASYYGRAFAGKMTANGEIFDPAEYTAAHKKLPFGTLVKVKNVDNGKTVVVRINDRGPFHGDRAIDLSKAAANDIGMTRTGTADVKLQIIG